MIPVVHSRTSMSLKRVHRRSLIHAAPTSADLKLLGQKTTYFVYTTLIHSLCLYFDVFLCILRPKLCMLQVHRADASRLDRKQS